MARSVWRWVEPRIGHTREANRPPPKFNENNLELRNVYEPFRGRVNVRIYGTSRWCVSNKSLK